MKDDLQGYRKWRRDYPKTMFFVFCVVTTMAFPLGMIWIVIDYFIKDNKGKPE